MARATFSLDEATIAEIRRTAERLRKPQSHIIREAVADFAARTDRLSEREQKRLLDVMTAFRKKKPDRTARQVDAEIQSVREARRSGGRARDRS